MAKDRTIYERLTSPTGKALGVGAVTAAALLGLRGAAKSKLVSQGLAKALKTTDRVRGTRQMSLPFDYSMRAKKILGDQINSGGVLSKGNIALASGLGGASGALMADFSRKNYAENLAIKLQSGKPLSRSEKQAIRQIGDLRKLPKRSNKDLSAEQRGKTLYWNPRTAGLTAGALGAVLTPGPAAVRLGMGALGAASAVGDTKYRQFIMAKALSDRLNKKRDLLPSEKKLIQAVKGLGAERA